MGREFLRMSENREFSSMNQRKEVDFRTFYKYYASVGQKSELIIRAHQTKETSLATYLVRHHSGHYHHPVHNSNDEARFVPVSEFKNPTEGLVKKVLAQAINHRHIAPGLVDNPSFLDPRVLKLLSLINFADFFKQFKEKRLSEFNSQKSNQGLIDHLIELKLLTPANFYDFFSQFKTMKLSDIQTKNFDRDLISLLIKMSEYCEFVELNFPGGIPTDVYQFEPIKIADQRLIQLSLDTANTSFIIPPFKRSKPDYLRDYGLQETWSNSRYFEPGAGIPLRPA